MSVMLDLHNMITYFVDIPDIYFLMLICHVHYSLTVVPSSVVTLCI